MALSLLAIGPAESRVSVQRAGGVLAAGQAPMALLSGDRIRLGPTSGSLCVLGDARGASFALLEGAALTIAYFQSKWREAPKAGSTSRVVLPPPFDQWMEILERFLPSVFGSFQGDLEASGREWMGPFWAALPDGNQEIVPISLDLEEGVLVGSLSGVGLLSQDDPFPALHRLRVPGACYEAHAAVYLARVGEAGSRPESWRTVELFCQSGELRVEPSSGLSPILLGPGQGVRYQVRSDRVTTAMEILNEIPGDVQSAIEANAFGWLDLTGEVNHVVETVWPGDGSFRIGARVAEDSVQILDLNELILPHVGDLPFISAAKPYLLGMRLTGGVAENEGVMFEKFEAEGTEARAGVEPWMRDVRPGDAVRLYVRLPVSLLESQQQIEP